MLRTVALTGATGFVGSVIARHLQSQGWHVKALVRPTSRVQRLSGLKVDAVSGHLEDEPGLEQLVRGVDAVVHCAGAVRGTRPDDFQRVNASAVSRLARIASEQRPTPRFILISSLAARLPEVSPYADSKRRGEVALVESCGDMGWAVLRPPAIYGPGDREMMPLLRWAARGVAPCLGHRRARFSLLYVDDLARAVVALLKADCLAAGGGIYELHDGRHAGYRWDDVLDVVSHVCQRPVLRIPVPSAVLQVAAVANVFASRLFGRMPMLTPGKVRELRHGDWVCDNTRVAHALGWLPRMSLEEGLRVTLGLPGR